MTPEQLGLGQSEDGVLRLPDGLETVGEQWFQQSRIEKVIIPSSVTVLGKRAFYYCGQLREVTFEPGSHLECIENACFNGCKFEKIVIPKSV